MTDRVNTTMHRQQPPLGHPVTNHPPAHSSREQLAARDDPMLALSQLGDPQIDRTRVIFGPYIGLNFTLAGHARKVGGVRRAGVRRTSPISRETVARFALAPSWAP